MQPVILVNRGGGSAGDDAYAKVSAALSAAGISGKVEVLDDAIDRRAGEAVAAGTTLVIAGGGDGTMSAVAGALSGTNVTLGILPMGTLNHFARDLAIPTDLPQAARLIATGTMRKIDIATLGDRRFVNNSAVGLYPLMVADREVQQHRLGRVKLPAMLVASLHTFVRHRHSCLTLTVNDGAPRTIDTPLLFVGNNDYRLEMPGAGSRESLSDGRLCVFIARKQGRLAFAMTAIRALVGRTRAIDLIRLEDVTSLTVVSHRDHLQVAIDGETCRFAPPLDYRILPGALNVIAPA